MISSWPIARGIALRSDAKSGYVLDGFGGLHPFGGAPNVAVSGYWLTEAMKSVFIDAVLNDQEIPIHGDGLQTRSFTYVSDTVAGIYASIVKPEANGEVFNIGSTHEITILDLAKTIKRLSNTPGELKLRFVPYESFTGRSYEDVRRRIPDVSRCEQILGVKAVVGLEKGLARTIEWQRRTVERESVAR